MGKPRLSDEQILLGREKLPIDEVQPEMEHFVTVWNQYCGDPTISQHDLAHDSDTSQGAIARAAHKLRKNPRLIIKVGNLAPRVVSLTLPGIKEAPAAGPVRPRPKGARKSAKKPAAAPDDEPQLF